MIDHAPRYIDPETGRQVELATIDRLIAQVRDARTKQQRRAAIVQLLSFGTSLTRIAADLEQRLTVGGDMLGWLEDQKDPDDPRTSQWEQFLANYEAVNDRLSLIENQVLADRPDLIRLRRDPDAEARAA